MREAQLLGMPTTATMMFGSIETAAERIEHMHVLRELQDETGGFTAFIPWYYVPFKTPLRGKRGDRARVPARARRLAAVPRQLPAPAGLVADAGAEDWASSRSSTAATTWAARSSKSASCTTPAAPTKRRAATSRTLIIEAGFTPVIRDTYWNLRTTWRWPCHPERSAQRRSRRSERRALARVVEGLCNRGGAEHFVAVVIEQRDELAGCDRALRLVEAQRERAVGARRRAAARAGARAVADHRQHAAFRRARSVPGE